MTSSLIWRREGMLIPVKEAHPWWVTHAQAPTVLPLSERLWRIYFAGRERNNRSHIMAVDVDPLDGMRVVAEHLEPLIELGPPGAFDHEGMGPACALAVDGRILLYYTGVAVRRDVRFQLAIGVAASADGLKFEKLFPGPIRSSGPFDPCYVSTPAVTRTLHGFRMWYISATAWQPHEDSLEPRYDIKTSCSADGLMWDMRAQTAVALDEPREAGLARPWVISRNGGLQMWYCSRGVAYRAPGPDAYRLMSMAVNANGIGIAPAEPVSFSNPPAREDFDGWMQCYPCVVPHGRDLVMFYNGNDFGRAGFGWARAIDAPSAGQSSAGL